MHRSECSAMTLLQTNTKIAKMERKVLVKAGPTLLKHLIRLFKNFSVDRAKFLTQRRLKEP